MRKAKELIAVIFILALSGPTFLPGVNAQALRNSKSKRASEKQNKTDLTIKHKISPDLESIIGEAAASAADRKVRVIIQLRSETGLNEIFGSKKDADRTRSLIERDAQLN